MDDTGELTNEKPLNKKGVYRLSNVQYEQVRRWVLQCSKLSIPWQKKYQIYLQGFKPSGRKRKGNTETPMSFIPWLREQVKHSVFLPAVLGFLLSVYSLKSIGSDMSGQESTEKLQAEHSEIDTGQSQNLAKSGLYVVAFWYYSRPSLVSRFFEHLGGSSSSDSQVSGGGGSCVSSKGKKKVEFDSDEQPVGDGSKEFSSLLGGTTKTHCPISYESFKNVPSPTKNIIWSSVVENPPIDMVDMDSKTQDNLKFYFHGKIPSEVFDLSFPDDIVDFLCEVEEKAEKEDESEGQESEEESDEGEEEGSVEGEDEDKSCKVVGRKIIKK
ncbi:hypothetical protein IFM89_032203, partial [Coptis chinensis]